MSTSRVQGNFEVASTYGSRRAWLVCWMEQWERSKFASWDTEEEARTHMELLRQVPAVTWVGLAEQIEEIVRCA